MRLKLDALQRVVKRTMTEEKDLDVLREEVKRVLGSKVLTDVKLTEMVKSANAYMDIMERVGKINRLDFKANVVGRYMDHNDPEVRRFAARVVPEKFLGKMITDRATSVRAVVAARAPKETVKEMMKNFPTDDQLRVIFRKRFLSESGIKQPTVVKEPFDMYGEERLGDSVKQPKGPELSEQWYKDKAFKLMQDYGTNIEYSWEEQACRAFAQHSKMTSGVEIDEAKLLKAVKDLIEEREDRALERDALKETLEWLNGQQEAERMNESVMPVIDEAVSPIEELLEADLGSEIFIDRVNEMFKVRESTLPKGIKKYRLGEGTSVEVNVPVVGMMPEGADSAKCEKALDKYCESWTKRQALNGEPLKLEWSYNPTQVGKVCFSVILR